MTTARPGDSPSQGCPASVTRLHDTTAGTGRDGLRAVLRERHGPVAPVELESGVDDEHLDPGG